MNLWLSIVIIVGQALLASSSSASTPPTPAPLTPGEIAVNDLFMAESIDKDTIGLPQQIVRWVISSRGEPVSPKLNENQEKLEKALDSVLQPRSFLTSAVSEISRTLPKSTLEPVEAFFRDEAGRKVIVRKVVDYRAAKTLATGKRGTLCASIGDARPLKDAQEEIVFEEFKRHALPLTKAPEPWSPKQRAEFEEKSCHYLYSNLSDEELSKWATFLKSAPAASVSGAIKTRQWRWIVGHSSEMIAAIKDYMKETPSAKK